jgi:hypothetical protein
MVSGGFCVKVWQGETFTGDDCITTATNLEVPDT